MHMMAQHNLTILLLLLLLLLCLQDHLDRVWWRLPRLAC
jgi:hypothetical protein